MLDPTKFHALRRHEAEDENITGIPWTPNSGDEDKRYGYVFGPKDGKFQHVATCFNMRRARIFADDANANGLTPDGTNISMVKDK